MTGKWATRWGFNTNQQSLGFFSRWKQESELWRCWNVAKIGNTACVWMTFFWLLVLKMPLSAKDYMGIKPSSVLRCSHKDLMFLIRSKTCVTDQLFHAAGFKFHPIFFASTSCLLIHVPSWQLTDPIPAGTFEDVVPWRVCSLCNEELFLLRIGWIQTKNK